MKFWPWRKKAEAPRGRRGLMKASLAINRNGVFLRTAEVWAEFHVVEETEEFLRGEFVAVYGDDCVDVSDIQRVIPPWFAKECGSVVWLDSDQPDLLAALGYAK